MINCATVVTPAEVCFATGEVPKNPNLFGIDVHIDDAQGVILAGGAHIGQFFAF